MSLVLAIDTCLNTTGVALVENEKPIAATYYRSERTHAFRLINDIDTVLASRQIRIADIDCIAVTIGPGSFTGVRIGLTTAKTLAYSQGIPLVGVSTLECLAIGASAHETTVAVVIDAKKNEVYAALYKFDTSLSDPTCICTPFVDHPVAAAKRLVGAASEWGPQNSAPLVVGDGAAVYADTFSGYPFRCGAPMWGVLHPEHVGALGTHRFLQGQGASWESLEPVYLRKAEAELTIGPPTGAPVIEVRTPPVRDP